MTLIAQYHETCDQWVRRLLTPGSRCGPGVTLRSLTGSKFYVPRTPGYRFFYWPQTGITAARFLVKYWWCEDYDFLAPDVLWLGVLEQKLKLHIILKKHTKIQMHNRVENWQNLYGSHVYLMLGICSFLCHHLFPLKGEYRIKRKLWKFLVNHVFIIHVNCQVIAKFTQSLLPLRTRRPPHYVFRPWAPVVIIFT